PEVPEFRSFKPDVVVGANGTLYLQMAADRPGDEPTRPVVARSTDHGAAFTVAEVGPASRYFPQHRLAWSPLGGPEGALYSVVEDKVDPRPAAGDRDILYRRSTDGGRTFREAIKLNDDDPAQGYLQLLPAVPTAPNARVDAAWWDFRDDPGLFANDVYYAYSDDNGATWSKNIRRRTARAAGTSGNGPTTSTSKRPPVSSRPTSSRCWAGRTPGWAMPRPSPRTSSPAPCSSHRSSRNGRTAGRTQSRPPPD
ncbi:MAG: sialidase family protein, partial [Acidimicrobiales bacterium]